MTSLYHVEVGFPARVRLPTKRKLAPTAHARNESTGDCRYKEFDMPLGIVFKGYDAHLVYRGEDGADVRTGFVFEIEVEDGEVVKVGARCDYDDEYDITVILDPRGDGDSEGTPEATLITCWLNKKDDTHDTLDESKYDEPEMVTA